MAASSEVHRQPVREHRSLSRTTVVVRTMHDTDRTGHAPHKILRRTACVHRSRDTVRCVAPFVLLLVDGF